MGKLPAAIDSCPYGVGTPADTAEEKIAEKIHEDLRLSKVIAVTGALLAAATF